MMYDVDDGDAFLFGCSLFICMCKLIDQCPETIT
jgi:hypothetical protein